MRWANRQQRKQRRDKARRDRGRAPWFAWYPVTIWIKADGYTVWLERVDRWWAWQGERSGWGWEYRALDGD